jgi:hypothetical protein
MDKGQPRTSYAIPSTHRTLTESVPPIQAKIAARLAAPEDREPKATGGRSKAIRIDEMAASVQDRLRAAVRERAASRARAADPAHADQARDAALARFTARELGVAYTSRGQAHTLRELVHMLFDLTSDPDRDRATAFLAPVLR